jgi:hypothetical protein
MSITSLMESRVEKLDVKLRKYCQYWGASSWGWVIYQKKLLFVMVVGVNGHNRDFSHEQWDSGIVQEWIQNAAKLEPYFP